MRSMLVVTLLRRNGYRPCKHGY